jgi:hypothetical protein
MLSPLDTALFAIIAALIVVVVGLAATSWRLHLALAVLRVEHRHLGEKSKELADGKLAAEAQVKNKNSHISELREGGNDALKKLRHNAFLAGLAIGLLRVTDAELRALRAEMAKKVTSEQELRELQQMLDMMAKASQNAQHGRNVPPA